MKTATLLYVLMISMWAQADSINTTGIALQNEGFSSVPIDTQPLLNATTFGDFDELAFIMPITYAANGFWSALISIEGISYQASGLLDLAKFDGTQFLCFDVSGLPITYRGVPALFVFYYDGHYVVDDFTWLANRTTVPEPGSLTLLGTGLLGIVAAARKRYIRT